MSKWPLMRLGDVCEINPPKQQMLDMFEGKEVSFVSMSSVDENGNINVSDIRPFSDVSNGYSYFIENDVLFAKITPCMENGKGAIARGLKNGIGVGSTEFHILRANEEKITSEWIYRFLSLPRIRKLAEKNMIGSAGQKRVPKSFLENVKIPLPPLNVQKNITNILDKTQEIIDGYKKQLAELDNLIRAVFYEMFGDPLINDKGWVTVLLKEVLLNIKYGTSTPPNFSDTGYKFIRATNIKNGRIVEEDMKFISGEEGLKFKKCRIYENEMIIVRSGVNAGDTCVITSEYSGHYAGYDLILTFDQYKVDPVFVNELFNTNYMDIVIKPLTRRAAQPHLNLEQVQTLRIILPPLDLQNKFTDIVTKIEEQKTLVKQAITESEHLFNSLMSEYFD
ncbi:MAG TPA: hypothetical protein GXX33_06990 [Firmicutes bacterium]|nr:hypothetical protein [Bacillota bacterium]